MKSSTMLCIDCKAASLLLEKSLKPRLLARFEVSCHRKLRQEAVQV